jgi:hypothetical protein
MAPVWDASGGSGASGTIVIEGVRHREVRLWVQACLDAVRGSLSADRSAERPTESNTGLVSVEELIRVLLQQAGRAEKANSSRWVVIGGELERSEHPLAVEERPSHMADAFDPHAVRQSLKMSCWRLIQRPDKVTPLIRD